MLKAGLIGAGVSFLLTVLLTLLTPLCDPCAVLLIGFGVGLLTAFWERPVTQGVGATRGAEAGAIAAAGGLVGEMMGAVLNGILVGPEKTANLLRGLGFSEDLITFTPGSYWASLLAMNCCCALVGIALGAGLGALGGLVGHQIWRPGEPSPESGIEL